MSLRPYAQRKARDGDFKRKPRKKTHADMPTPPAQTGPYGKPKKPHKKKLARAAAKAEGKGTKKGSKKSTRKARKG